MTTRLYQLPIADRLRLVEDIWDSIAADQAALPLTSEQRRELERRLDAYRVSGDPGQPASLVIEKLRDR